MNQKVIHEIHKNHATVIRISIDMYQGKDYVDVREFYLGDDDEFHPTKKGVKFSQDLVGDMVKGLKQLQKGEDSADGEQDDCE